jgi:hypothetical protein
MSRFTQLAKLAVLLSVGAVLFALLVSYPVGDPGPSPRTQSGLNLRQFGLAFNTYSLNYGHGFPPVGGGNGMHPGLSWRVAILPFIEEEDLYAKFHLDEPWDSPHNKTLIPLMSRTYANPGVEDAPGFTRYRAVVGDFTAFEKPVAGREPLGRDPKNWPDGIRKPVCVVEAADPVVWTRPDELEYDPTQPLPRLGAYWSGRCQIVFSDASVGSYRPDTDEAELRELFSGPGRR